MLNNIMEIGKASPQILDICTKSKENQYYDIKSELERGVSLNSLN